MSDDLISRKTLMEEIQSFRCSITGLRAGKGVLAHAADEYRKSILQIIEDQPTAFNKENVIEQIREKVSDCYLEYCGKYNNCLQCRADEAVKIVEKGGLN